VRVQLTALGRSLKADFFRIAKVVNQAFSKGLGKNEVAECRRLMKRLIEIMRKKSKTKFRFDRSLIVSGEPK
jgi:hypothetical protein